MADSPSRDSGELTVADADSGAQRELHHITRIDIEPSDAYPKRHPTHGWQVRARRDGKRLSKFFADAKHGDRDEALDAAKDVLPGGVAREVVDLMFSFPYLKIATLEEYGLAKRQTASKYLRALTAEDGGPDLLVPFKYGRDVYFVNDQLMRLLTEPVARP